MNKLLQELKFLILALLLLFMLAMLMEWHEVDDPDIKVESKQGLSYSTLIAVTPQGAEDLSQRHLPAAKTADGLDIALAWTISNHELPDLIDAVLKKGLIIR